MSHSQQWFEENFPDDENAKTQPAFIHEGKLYIKNDSLEGTTASVHELAHLILAGLRWNSDKNKRSFYYELMDKIDPEAHKAELGNIVDEYAKNRIGSDLKEEIFAKILEKYFTDNMLPANWRDGVELQSSTEYLLEALNDLLGVHINSTEDFFRAVKSDLSDVLQMFGSSLFEFDWSGDLSQESMISTQKVADLKDRLRKANLLEETECN